MACRNSRNILVPKASEYISMNFQTVQAFLKVLSMFLEFLQAIKCLQSFRIFFYEFSNSPGLPESPNYFIEFLQAIKCLQSFRIFFYEFSNSPGLSESPKYVSRISTSHKMSPKLQNIFLWIFKQSRPFWKS